MFPFPPSMVAGITLEPASSSPKDSAESKMILEEVRNQHGLVEIFLLSIGALSLLHGSWNLRYQNY